MLFADGDMKINFGGKSSFRNTSIEREAKLRTKYLLMLKKMSEYWPTLLGPY